MSEIEQDEYENWAEDYLFENEKANHDVDEHDDCQIHGCLLI